MAGSCNRDFIYQWAPVHNARDEYWVPNWHGASLRTVPTLRQKLKYLTQHKVKQSQVTDWTVNSTNSITMKILHFNAQSKWSSILDVLSVCKTQRPTYHSNTEKWQCFCGNGCFWQTWLDHWDWIQRGIQQWADILYKVVLDLKNILTWENVKMLDIDVFTFTKTTAFCLVFFSFLFFNCSFPSTNSAGSVESCGRI